MPSAARKPQPIDDSPETTPALAVAPKTRQRHDPKAKAQAALDRAQAQVNALSVEIGKHQTALDSANNKLKLALQHREYLAMHPLLQTQKDPTHGAVSAEVRAEIGIPEGDLSTP